MSHKFGAFFIPAPNLSLSYALQTWVKNHPPLPILFTDYTVVTLQPDLKTVKIRTAVNYDVNKKIKATNAITYKCILSL